MNSRRGRYPFLASARAGSGRRPPMKKLYTVSLTEEQRATLKALITRGEAAARALTRARILLKADTNHAHGGWSDREISEALETSRPTVERVRQRFAQEGLAVVYPRPRMTTPERRLDGEQEAHLVALACSAPPPGRQRWSLRLL